MSVSKTLDARAFIKLTNLKAAGGELPFTIFQGSDVTYLLPVYAANGDPFDLTGASVQGRMSTSYGGDVSYMDVSIMNPPEDGNLSLSFTDTAGIVAERWVYNIDVTKNNTVYRVYHGTVSVLPGVNA